MDDKSPVHKMTPKEVYNSHPEFKQYDPERFKANLRELRKAVKKRKKIVEEDERQFWQQQFTNPRKELTSKGDPFGTPIKQKQALKRISRMVMQINFCPVNYEKRGRSIKPSPKRCFVDMCTRKGGGSERNPSGSLKETKKAY